MTAYVSGYSKISASMSGASAGRNASITSYRLIINGVTFTTSSATSDVISKSGTVTVTARITDSRGRNSTVVTKNITFTAYKPPSITTFKAARQSTSTTVKVDWAVSYLNITGNSVTTKIETKQSTASSWSSFQANTTSTSGSKNLTGVSDLVTQQFRLTSTDSFGNSVSRIITVGTAKVAFSIGKNEGIGAGKVWEKGAIDASGNAYLETSNGLVILSPTGWRISSRASIKLLSKTDNPSEIDLYRMTPEGDETGWQISSRQESMDGALNFYHYIDGEYTVIFRLFPDGDVTANGYQVLHRGLVQCGQVNITPTANSPSTVRVYFPVRFPQRPRVVVSAHSAAPYTLVREVTYTNPTQDYVDIVMYRTDSTATSVSWIAIVDG
jgi:hypothetical protein